MRLIKNTTEGARGTYIGAGEKEHLLFPGGAVTEVADAKLKEALTDPIVKSWFDDGILVEQTPAAKVEAKVEAKTESKKDDAKK